MKTTASIFYTILGVIVLSFAMTIVTAVREHTAVASATPQAIITPAAPSH